MKAQNQKRDNNMADDDDRKETTAGASVNDDETGAATTEVEEDNKKRKDKTNQEDFVFCKVLINERESRITKIKVNQGDDIISITKKIKSENSNLFASVDAVQIQLYQSNTSAVEESEIENNTTLLSETAEPLNPVEEWSPKVSWGTKAQPLIVEAPQTNSGECTELDNLFHIFDYLLQQAFSTLPANFEMKH
jgi:hypothetical protein